jgi:hypothetical protein
MASNLSWLLVTFIVAPFVAIMTVIFLSSPAFRSDLKGYSLKGFFFWRGHFWGKDWRNLGLILPAGCPG